MTDTITIAQRVQELEAWNVCECIKFKAQQHDVFFMTFNFCPFCGGKILTNPTKADS